METSQGAEFSLRPAMERTPFADVPTQTFFTKWCEVNDSIKPRYVSREEYDKQRDKGILQKNPENPKQSTLFVPEDLKLWEMADVIEAVDKDTFSHNKAKTPGKRKELNDLGEMFTNAGIYIAQNIDNVHRGRQTAERTAKDLYRYGNALRTGNYDEKTEIEEIAGNSLNDKQAEQVDTWFGVDKLAKFKGKNPDDTRKDMFAHFFEVTEKAKTSEPHRKALERTQRRLLEKPINQPQQELEDAFFRRGLEKLANETGINLEGQQKSLMETLEIPRLKQELSDLRATSNISAISDKEREIAGKIQIAVSKMPYEDSLNGSFPSNIAERQYRDCVGASLLGGVLLHEAGINYLLLCEPDHSSTLLITSDNNVYMQDFQSRRPEANKKLRNSDIEGSAQDGGPLTTEDIVAYSHSPSNTGLVFAIDSHHGFYARSPEQGHRVEVINNMGIALAMEGDYQAAVESFKHSLVLDKNDPNTYANLSQAYIDLGENEESVESAKKALNLDPRNGITYGVLGVGLENLGRREEASEAFKKAIELDPENEDAKKYFELEGS